MKTKQSARGGFEPSPLRQNEKRPSFDGLGGIFVKGEYSHACRLRASSTRSARRMRTHVANATVFKSVHRLEQKKRRTPRGNTSFSGGIFAKGEYSYHSPLVSELPTASLGMRTHVANATVYGDAPEENNEYAEPQTCEGDGIRLYFRAVGEPWFESREIKIRLS